MYRSVTESHGAHCERLAGRLSVAYDEWAAKFNGVRRPDWLLWLDDKCAAVADGPVGDTVRAAGRWLHAWIYSFRCMEVT